MSSQTYNPHTQRMLRDVIYFQTNYNWLYGDMFAESNTSLSKTPKWNFELSDLPVFLPDNSSAGTAKIQFVADRGKSLLTLRIQFSKDNYVREIQYNSKESIVLGFYDAKEFSLSCLDEKKKEYQWISVSEPGDNHYGVLALQTIDANEQIEPIHWVILVDNTQYYALFEYLNDLITGHFAPYTPEL